MMFVIITHVCDKNMKINLLGSKGISVKIYVLIAIF